MEKQQYAVGWLTLAFINANLAQVKGRSGLLYLIGSLFLGPIMTAILSFLNPIEHSHIPE